MLAKWCLSVYRCLYQYGCTKKLCFSSVNIHLECLHIKEKCNMKKVATNRTTEKHQAFSWRGTSNYRSNHTVSHCFRKNLLSCKFTKHAWCHPASSPPRLRELFLGFESIKWCSQGKAWWCLSTVGVLSAAIIYSLLWLFVVVQRNTALNEMDYCIYNSLSLMPPFGGW